MVAHRCISFAIGAALLPHLLIFISQYGEVQPAPAPLFPLFGGLNPTLTTNSTSLLELLALSHLQHKIDTLTALGELFGVVGANSTLSG